MHKSQRKMTIPQMHYKCLIPGKYSRVPRRRLVYLCVCANRKYRKRRREEGTAGSVYRSRRKARQNQAAKKKSAAPRAAWRHGAAWKLAVSEERLCLTGEEGDLAEEETVD
jgi:hypothetical protein